MCYSKSTLQQTPIDRSLLKFLITFFAVCIEYYRFKFCTIILKLNNTFLIPWEKKYQMLVVKKKINLVGHLLRRKLPCLHCNPNCGKSKIFWQLKVIRYLPQTAFSELYDFLCFLFSCYVSDFRTCPSNGISYLSAKDVLVLRE